MSDIDICREDECGGGKPKGVSELEAMLERLAELEHEQWWRWALHLMQTEDHISPQRIARWKGSMVPYAQLTEENKEHDRIWARKVLEIVRSNVELTGGALAPSSEQSERG